jgi:hypothetical protein
VIEVGDGALLTGQVRARAAAPPPGLQQGIREHRQTTRIVEHLLDDPRGQLPLDQQPDRLRRFEGFRRLPHSVNGRRKGRAMHLTGSGRRQWISAVAPARCFWAAQSRAAAAVIVLSPDPRP